MIDKLMEQFKTDESLLLLSKGLDATALRHKLITNNIANANTAGFKASDVNFKDQVKKVMSENTDRKHLIPLAVTNEKHISSGPCNISEINPQAVKITDTYRKPDGNNVDIDREMATLAENSLEFRTYVRFVTDKLNGLSLAIKGN
jgi:flagellar basal-body rod protein FlgB